MQKEILPKEERMIPLTTLYLSVHALSWLEIVENDPRRKIKAWERWPGRSELSYQRDLQLKTKYCEIIREASKNEGTGILIIPNEMKKDYSSKGDKELITRASESFGLRCVVLADSNPHSLGQDFVCSVEEDVRNAIDTRGSLTQNEIDAWMRAKAWAISLQQQLKDQGYFFDSSTVKIVAWGEDWTGCVATYPIFMGGVWDLAFPILRSFDLITPDESELYLKATSVVQDIPLPDNDNIRLFLHKSYDGIYFAEYYEGKRCLKDPGHSVILHFPEDAVSTLSVSDLLQGNTTGEKQSGYIEAVVGCGGHTPFNPTIIVAEENMPFDDFYSILLSGKTRTYTVE
jgi:hypothetical protein